MKISFPIRLLTVLCLFLTELPDGEAVAAGLKPAQPEQSDSVLVESISAGEYHTCGLKSDGTLACWGSNGFGQIAFNRTYLPMVLEK